MAARQVMASALAAACFSLAAPLVSAEGAKAACRSSFVLDETASSSGDADLEGASVVRFSVEMGATTGALVLKGDGVSGAYKAAGPDLKIWNYMSTYNPAKDWLKPGGLQFDYSGFRIEWPQFKLRGKPVKAVKLTVTQGERSMTIDVGADAKGVPFTSQVMAIDFEDMLGRRYPIVRVDDHQAWRAADTSSGSAISVVFTDPANGKVIARAQASPRVAPDKQQVLLSGAVNAMRDVYKAGKCT